MNGPCTPGLRSDAGVRSETAFPRCMLSRGEPSLCRCQPATQPTAGCLLRIITPEGRRSRRARALRQQ